MVKVLITGGAGFIGSTIGSACLDAGHTPIILDNLSCGVRAFTDGRPFYEGDIADGTLIHRIFAEHPDISVTIHAAALVVVPDSVRNPVAYYRTNVADSIELMQSLERNGCRRLVFSSSASIYGSNEHCVVDESSSTDPKNPYARSKAMVEEILHDAAVSGSLDVVSLRYFNPIGADPQRRTGLQLRFPSHALGRLIHCHNSGTPFVVAGVDWPTRDGSAIRDFVHVWDLARAHVHAIERFDQILAGTSGYDVINVGTGNGTTILELVAAFKHVVGQDIKIAMGARRPGDVVGSYARTDKAHRVLGWHAELTIEQAIRDAIEWSKIRDSRDIGLNSPDTDPIAMRPRDGPHEGEI